MMNSYDHNLARMFVVLLIHVCATRGSGNLQESLDPESIMAKLGDWNIPGRMPV